MDSTIICPHCGAETEDPEYCRVCGEVLVDLPAEKKIEQFSIKEEVLFSGMIERLFSSFKPCCYRCCNFWDDDIWAGDPESSPYFLDEEIDEMFDSED